MQMNILVIPCSRDTGVTPDTSKGQQPQFLPHRPHLLLNTITQTRFSCLCVIQVYWHSSAHILGEAMEKVYGGCLCYGPPVENGFYYDMFLENE